MYNIDIRNFLSLEICLSFQITIFCSDSFQLMFRLVTFVLNAYILRHVSKEFLGVVNVRSAQKLRTLLTVTSKTRNEISKQNDFVKTK
jgi:hypothetical protein